MLKVKNIRVGYGNVPVIFDFSFEVKKGEVVAIVGSNGAGKSTLLKTISGILKPTAGEILFNGKRIDTIPAYRVVELGISHVPEGRQVFGKMSIKDNLMLGAYVLRSESDKVSRLKEVYDLFPILWERENQKAETLSGGEQQMLAIARGLMSNPKLLMVDEMSLGLAPFLVDRVWTRKGHKGQGYGATGEQKVQEALEIADRLCAAKRQACNRGHWGRTSESDIVKKAYLGL